jgi:putative tricarboxylic transport membrane protein
MKSDLISSVAFFGLCVVAMAGGLNLDIGTISAPGPGMYPLFLGAAGAIMSILLGLSALRHRSDLIALPKGFAGPTLVVIATLIGFVSLLPILGLAPSSVLLMAVLFWVGKMRSLRRLIALSLLMGIGADVACRLIGIPLPQNLLSQLLTGA